MKIHVLFDARGPRLPSDAPPDAAPTIDSFGPLLEQLTAGRQALSRVPVGDIIGLCDAAARAWTQPNHPLADLIRRHGLGFLPLWMRKGNLEDVCNRSLRERPQSLERFVALSDTDAMLLRAQPRGLVVHWVAGNVPVVGLLSVLQSLLCKNANIVKVAHSSGGVLPCLLGGLAEATYTNPDGLAVDGHVLTDAVAAVYVDRHDREAAAALSTLADVRVAWGGREAVEAIMNLPRRFGTEDVIFGPKTSFAVVGAERLEGEEPAEQTAMAIARDASAFDQLGCNSPHTVFAERGGCVSPREFARVLSHALATIARQAPLAQVDPADAMNVLAVRAEYDMRGEAYYSQGMGWTVAYSDDDRGLAEPCYLRTIFVRPVDDVFDVVPCCSLLTQTVGLAVDDRRHKLAEALTARGVDRCPDVGKMRLYEVPWDGLFPMERLVRWVSTY